MFRQRIPNIWGDFRLSEQILSEMNRWVPLKRDYSLSDTVLYLWRLGKSHFGPSVTWSNFKEYCYSLLDWTLVCDTVTIPFLTGIHIERDNVDQHDNADEMNLAFEPLIPHPPHPDIRQGSPIEGGRVNNFTSAPPWF